MCRIELTDTHQPIYLYSQQKLIRNCEKNAIGRVNFRYIACSWIRSHLSSLVCYNFSRVFPAIEEIDARTIFLGLLWRSAFAIDSYVYSWDYRTIIASQIGPIWQHLDSTLAAY